MKHLKHAAMCAPMLVLGGVLLISGAGFGSLVPLVACVVMMAMMMRVMDHGGGSGANGG